MLVPILLYFFFKFNMLLQFKIQDLSDESLIGSFSLKKWGTLSHVCTRKQSPEAGPLQTPVDPRDELPSWSNSPPGLTALDGPTANDPHQTSVSSSIKG